MEETEGRQDDARGPHEAQGQRRRGHLRVVRALRSAAHVPQEELLAPAGSRTRLTALLV